ncbi:hypothetical protein FBU59_004321 [Linderina macrospora]|uniref:Uncharacterized protein n=1 Tax=Linderina macrospora TaxID=4868 RepID=A0ACC1J624_9FUNG|nr:hypothetical protein FBU59_004321 [Linderina macrospora]
MPRHPPGYVPGSLVINTSQSQAAQRPRGLSSASSAPSRPSRSRHGSHAIATSPYRRPGADPHSPRRPTSEASYPQAGQAQSPQSPQSPSSSKRKYKRHPKKDINAPAKWRSAYQLFRDDIYNELQGQGIEFGSMSKIQSERWRALDAAAKEQYEERVRLDRTRYEQQMEVYKHTTEYRTYQAYLERFHAQENTVNRVGRPRGRTNSRSRQKAQSSAQNPESAQETYAEDMGKRSRSSSMSINEQSSGE